jgi:hypothetical protein
MLVPERLVAAVPGGAEVLDTNLKTIQVLRAGRKSALPAITATDTGILSLSSNGHDTFYGGTPLREIPAAPAIPGAAGEQIVSTLDGSWRLLREGNALIEARLGAQPRTFADLSWVIPPCGEQGRCQADDTATRYQTVLGKRNRVLVESTGTHVPIQGSFGLLPYFRVQVFDLDTGAEVYREEDEFRAREREAVLSPDGDIVVVSDGYSAVVHRLP